MNEQLTLKPTTPIALDPKSDTFKLLEENIEVALGNLSAKNRKEYEATLRMWSGFAHKQGFNQFDFDLIRVKAFLTENNWSFNTRKVRLAHLRKFAELFALADVDGKLGFAFNYGRLALLKPKSLGGKKQVIKGRALTHKEIYKLFDALMFDSNQKTRDRAILGLMLLAGLRASEVTKVKWDEVDYEGRRLFIFEGKGDTSLHIPMLGDLPQILRQWQLKQAESGEFTFICCQVYRSDFCGENKQMNSRLINNVIAKIADETGINFRPHDTRRTAITSLLDAGASVAETRDFARHASGETTLRYAQATSAKMLGVKLKDKLKYGGVLGDMKQSEQARYWECSNHHKFLAVKPNECPECHNTDLSFQVSLFDD